MKGPSAIVQGLKGWVTRRPTSSPLADLETPDAEVISTCGTHALTDGIELDPQREFRDERDRWPLGPSVDNYS